MSPHSKTPIKGKEHAFQGSFTAWKEVKVFFLIKSLIYSVLKQESGLGL
jgi:hypothetical protein